MFSMTHVWPQLIRRAPADVLHRFLRRVHRRAPAPPSDHFRLERAILLAKRSDHIVVVRVFRHDTTPNSSKGSCRDESGLMSPVESLNMLRAMAKKQSALRDPVQVVLRDVQGGVSADLKMPECTVVNVQIVLDRVQGRVNADLKMPECTVISAQGRMVKR